MKRGRRATLAGLLACGAAPRGAPALAQPADPPRRIAVFPFELLDTSGEPQPPEQAARLARMAEELRAGLAASGRYTVVDTAPAAARLAAGPALRDCDGCEAALARELGAELALSGLVHKLSTLVLGMRLALRDAATGELRAMWSASFRGDNDEAWSRALAWLLRNRVLAAEATR